MKRAYNPTLDFSDSPVLGKFLRDSDDIIDSDEHVITKHFVRCIIGPMGSGKSTACCVELMRIATVQDVDPRTNTRRSRFAIVRNTQPELKSTTIKTWLERWPENACGPMRYSSPITHRVFVPPRHGKPGLDAEFFFIALDKPDDVNKLRSLDVTAIWINESDALSAGLITMATRRPGRFPPKETLEDGTQLRCRRACIIMDTNMPDETNYLTKLKDGVTPKNWTFYEQPMAVLEVEIKDGKYQSVEAANAGVFHVEQVIEAAGKSWVVNPHAENLSHLIGSYYPNQMSGSTLAEIQRYMQAKRVFLRAGKAVVPNYMEATHCRDELPILKDVPILLGADIGGGTFSPAVVFAQRNSRGGWLIHDELIGDDLGADDFSTMVVKKFGERFSGWRIEDARGWGDPAAQKGDEVYKVAVFDHFRSKDISLQPASSNDPQLRIGAIIDALGRMIDGVPYVLIHKRCVQLRAALAGGWHYKKMALLNEDRYHEEPNKTHPDSDIGDALGYLLYGGGEGRRMRHGHNTQSFNKPAVMKVDFDLFNSDD